MIPGHRLRLYCLLGSTLCLLMSASLAEALQAAFTLGAFDALTGPRHHTVREHLVFAQQPWTFAWYLLKDLTAFVLLTGAGLAMAWGVLRGRKAFARWRREA